MSEERRRYVGAGLSDNSYHSLIRMATATGRHPSDLMTEYIERGIAQDVEQLSEEDMATKEMKVYLYLQKMKAEQTVRLMLRQVASSLLMFPDEDVADNVRALCNENAISFEELMKQVQETSLQVSSPISFEDESSIAQAKAFLFELMAQKVELPSNEVYEKGKEAGFNRPVLRAAKEALGIMAVRRPKSWVWVLPTGLKIPSMTEVRHGR